MGLRDDLALMELHQERGTLSAFMKGEECPRIPVNQIEDKKDQMKARMSGFDPRLIQRDQ